VEFVVPDAPRQVGVSGEDLLQVVEIGVRWLAIEAGEAELLPGDVHGAGCAVDLFALGVATIRSRSWLTALGWRCSGLRRRRLDHPFALLGPRQQVVQRQVNDARQVRVVLIVIIADRDHRHVAL
jgi:hypothetical protein